MTIKDLKKVLHPNRSVEISTPIYFYYGKAKNINRKILDLEVTYVASGTADCNQADTSCVLVDAE